MSLSDETKAALWSILAAGVLVDSALAEGVVIGLGAEADTAEGRAYSLFADVALADHTWLSGAVAHTQSSNDSFDLDTKFADLSLDHYFNPIGIRFGAGYWGDQNILESKDAHASIYLRGGWGSIAASYEHREFDLTFRSDALPEPRKIGFSSNGYGLSARFNTSKRTSIHIAGMSYDYSRQIELRPETDRLRFLGVSRISLMNSLIDYQISGGFEVDFGQRRVDFRYSRWKTAVIQSDVDSFSIGLLMPVGFAADMEFRLAMDDSVEFGKTTVFSVFLYLFS
jgi:hypothetical protein